MQSRILTLFREHFGAPGESLRPLHQDGSNRRYFRVTAADGRTAIGVVGPNPDENRAFLSYSRAFRSIGLPVPEIYRVDEAAGVYLEEDLGDTTLFEALTAARAEEAGGLPESVLPAYRRVLALLPRFQIEGGRAVDYGVAYPHSAFDRKSILWDLNYFKYHFLQLAHIPFNESRLEEDFHRLADYLLGADTRHFLYRDFQSRNIMLRDGEPWFIDYQGGRRGALQYDIASLLYDAKAAIPDDVRELLLDEYLDLLAERLPVERDEFHEQYRGYVLVRIMQAMGAYGYRGFFERKTHFLQSVPHAVRNIERILEEQLLPVRLPEIEAVFDRITNTPSLRGDTERLPPGLTVHIGSFSYKAGYPQDATGHGGGFVFDCRGVPNPGRNPEFAGLCGLDGVVVEFLESKPEATAFWDNVRGLIDAQIEAYTRRGFTSLSVDFGCTGGQHRSVYFADRLARHLRQRFPKVNVRVSHREEPAWAEARSRSGEAA
ncbi:MAG: phosphotransferase [Gemmatimonadetes bacterium]|nr:phosphotransferase [Gemmatimonadota bacterium]